ncbi:hypothetical protein [Streptomyces sp. NPDC002758]
MTIAARMYGGITRAIASTSTTVGDGGGVCCGQFRATRTDSWPTSVARASSGHRLMMGVRPNTRS